jgi:hypothetical protein
MVRGHGCAIKVLKSDKINSDYFSTEICHHILTSLLFKYHSGLQYFFFNNLCGIFFIETLTCLKVGGGLRWLDVSALKSGLLQIMDGRNKEAYQGGGEVAVVHHSRDRPAFVHKIGGCRKAK